MSPAHLHTLIMQLETISDTSAEHFTDFRAIPILSPLTFYPTFLMDDATLDHAISDGFTDDVLCIFFGIQVEFETNIAQGNPRIGQRKAPNTGLDDVLPEPNDKRVRLVSLKL